MAAPPAIDGETLQRLLREGAESWEEFRALAAERHHRFIPSDHVAVYAELRRLSADASSFLELGSAAGVVTIMADLLGYEAYGIEREPWLVERSAELAERFESRASFAEGSFVPAAFEDDVEHVPSDFLTSDAGACGYDELGLELDDFDLIYAYPWPGEEDWLRELVRRHARPGAMLLTYDVREGFQLVRDGEEIE
jgi:predicted O-methyltransferase YrrM